MGLHMIQLQLLLKVRILAHLRGQMMSKRYLIFGIPFGSSSLGLHS